MLMNSLKVALKIVLKFLKIRQVYLVLEGSIIFNGIIARLGQAEHSLKLYLA